MIHDLPALRRLLVVWQDLHLKKLNLHGRLYVTDYANLTYINKVYLTYWLYNGTLTL